MADSPYKQALKKHLSTFLRAVVRQIEGPPEEHDRMGSPMTQYITQTERYIADLEAHIDNPHTLYRLRKKHNRSDDRPIRNDKRAWN